MAGARARPKSIAIANQTAVQASASLNRTVCARRWKTPRSRARKNKTARINTTQEREGVSAEAGVAMSVERRSESRREAFGVRPDLNAPPPPHREPERVLLSAAETAALTHSLPSARRTTARHRA